MLLSQCIIFYEKGLTDAITSSGGTTIKYFDIKGGVTFDQSPLAVVNLTYIGTCIPVIYKHTTGFQILVLTWGSSGADISSASNNSFRVYYIA